MVLVWCAQAVIHLCYRDFISPRNEYAGLMFDEPGLVRMMIWNALFSLPVLLLPRTWDRPGAIILWYLYIVCFLPFGVLSLDMGKDATLAYSVVSFFIPFCLLCLLYRFWQPKAPLQLGHIPAAFCIIVFATIAVLGSIVMFYSFRGEIDLSLQTAYIRRLDARVTAGSRSITAYAGAFFSQAVVPVLIAFSLTKFSFRNVAVIPGFIGAIAIFAFNGTKSTVVTPIIMVVLGLALALRWNRGWQLLSGVLVFMVTAYLLDALYGNEFLTDIVIRRVFAVPVQLAHGYLEFYGTTGFLYFTDIGIISKMVSSPHGGRTASFIIGEDYFGIQGLNANVGAIPYGFAELGISGSWLICGCILGLILLLDRASISKNVRWTVPLAFAIAFRLSEQSFHTALISGGILIILAVFLFVTDDSSKSESVPTVMPPLAPDLRRCDELRV